MESDLVLKLSELLAEHHDFITPSTKSIKVVEIGKPNKQGEVVLMKMRVLRVEYKFHDGESGETLTMEGVGEINQDSGKGLYKATTGAMKYFLTKNFLIATGDDPEANKPKGEKRLAPAKRVEVTASESQLKEIADLCKDLGGTPKEVCEKMTNGLPPDGGSGEVRHHRDEEEPRQKLEAAAEKR
jgi:hypothetical protein